MTLIELLIAMVLMVIIMTVIASSLILGLKSTEQVQGQLLDSHDAQLVSVYLPSDLISAQPGALEKTASTGTGCADSPSEAWNVVRLTWSDVASSATTWFRVAYRVVQNGTDWRLARFSCQSSTQVGLTSATATVKLLVRGLQPPTSGLPTLVEDQERLKLRLTDASGYSFTIAASRRLVSFPNAPAPPRPRPVEISDVSMFDDDTDGRVDRVTVVFNGALPANCKDNTFLALNAAPSGGTIANVNFGATGSSTTTISLAEGAGALDTAIGDFRVRFTPTTGCDALAYDGPPVHDLARPVVTAFTAGPAGASNPLQGKAEPGDTFTIGFSEAVTGVPTSPGTLSLTNPTVNTLSMTGLTNGAVSMGSPGYFTGSNQSTFPITTTPSASAVGQYVITLGACATRCTQVIQNLIGGPMTFMPASSIMDAAGNVATQLGSTPVPTELLFRAF